MKTVKKLDNHSNMAIFFDKNLSPDNNARFNLAAFEINNSGSRAHMSINCFDFVHKKLKLANME